MVLVETDGHQGEAGAQHAIAAELEQDLASFLKKIGSKDTPTGSSQPTVKIDKVEMNWDLRGEDPDRLMTAFVEPLERMTENRVQAFDNVAAGVMSLVLLSISFLTLAIVYMAMPRWSGRS